MSKFVLNVYHNKIKTHVDERLEDKKSTENYLTNLFQLYDQTTKLNRELSQVGQFAHSFCLVFVGTKPLTCLSGILMLSVGDRPHSVLAVFGLLDPLPLACKTVVTK